MNVILNGAGGKLGAEVLALLTEKGERVAAVDKSGESNAPVTFCDLNDYKGEADVIIDFSSHFATEALVNYAAARRIPLVVATTGQTVAEIELIKEAAKKVPVFFSANMSVGIALLLDLAKKAAVVMGDADIEIIEKHHNRKVDAPSGTALMLANGIKEARQNGELVYGRQGSAKRTMGEIGVHAVRLGNIVGEHEVLICDGSQTITLKHEAYNRTLFAEGALVAAKWLTGQASGLYNMQDMLK